MKIPDGYELDLSASRRDSIILKKSPDPVWVATPKGQVVEARSATNTWPTKALAEAAIALATLHTIHRKDPTNLVHSTTRFGFRGCNGALANEQRNQADKQLTFPTRTLRSQFLRANRLQLLRALPLL